MPLISRRFCLTLLATLLLAHAAFVVHGAAHTYADSQGCELCTGHGNPSHAVPVSTPVVRAKETAGFERLLGESIDAEATSFPCRQRGPPAVA
ncbi:MAG: hypothetical protein OEW35_16470 [Gammaproteobacteria bacterium]|nr:hypothetical protein [Gammaproteobacteria bacterium]MDH4254834.1 hypothetical protein [Gammaproteobacteria bacterium]MDH5311479.1 hypothetical protein [Gammaproteobacteria bacterium]